MNPYYSNYYGNNYYNYAGILLNLQIMSSESRKAARGHRTSQVKSSRTASQEEAKSIV